MALNFALTTLKYCAALDTGALDPLGWDAARMMLSSVICDSDKLQVFKSVVRLDAISVVHLLAKPKASSKVRFHNEIVFKAIRAASGVDPDIAAAELIAPPAPIPIPLSGAAPTGVGASV